MERGAYTDSVGRDWVFLGSIEENPAFEDSFRKNKPQPSPPMGIDGVELPLPLPLGLESSQGGAAPSEADADGGGEHASYLVSIPPGLAMNEWLLFEQTGDSYVDDLDAEYVEALGWIDDLPETDDNLEFYGNESQARIVGPDGRTTLAATTFTPSATIGPVTAVRKVVTRLWGYTLSNGWNACTGTMIAADQGITAAHCLDFSNSSYEVLSFGSKLADGTGNITNHPAFFVNGAWFNNSFARNDWVVFKTSANVNLGTGVPFILDVSENEGAGYTVTHIGTPGFGGNNQPRPVMYQSGSCNITQAMNKTIRHNCDTVSGHSGGPIYKVHSSTFRKLIAVHQGQYITVNRGPKVAHWRPEIVSAMNALNIGSSGTPWSWIR